MTSFSFRTRPLEPQLPERRTPETSAAHGPANDHAELDLVVFTERIRLLNQQRAVIPVNLLIAGVVSAKVWPLFPVWVLALWLGSVCIVILARSLLRHRYQRAPRDAESARRWARFFVLGAFTTGCLWGLAGSVILVTPDPVYHLFILLVLGGVMAGGIVGNAAYLPAMLAFMLPSILPTIAALVTRPAVAQIQMGLMLAVFGAVLAIVGRSINNLIVESLRLRFEQNLLSLKLETSEAAMARAQETAHVGSWDIDLQTNIVAWSAETFRIFGVDPATSKPAYETMRALVHPDDRLAVEKDYADFVATGRSPGINHRIVMADGAIKYVHRIARTIYNAEGRALRANGIVEDITDRKKAEAKLEFAYILLRTQMEASPDGILVVDANRRITSFNQRFADMWNIPLTMLAEGNDELVLAMVVSSTKDQQKFSARVQHLYDHPEETSRDEVETKDGRFIDRHTVTLLAPGGKNLGRVWFFRDFTERKQAEALAIRMARHDVLTGLANRGVFVEAVQQAIAKAKRGEKGFAVIYLDLDHFKDVNDTLGHPVGDELLKAVADRLRSITRGTDTVARFGGDEFAVVASEISEPTDAAILADKVINAFGHPFSIHGNDIRSGASIGIDLYGPEASDAETLLSHADVALYRAKSEGRGAYRFFTEAMDTEVRTRVTLGAELRVALASGQFFLLYQPQVAVDSGKIIGLEALVRWRHPERGVLGPDLFIPVAEKSGIVVKLGQWVLLTACRQARAWIDAGIAPVRIAVNVSALQFKMPVALESDIAAALVETGLPPSLLELELTETVLMEAARERSDTLARLRETGITIALDDFGTGYSSLEYLSRFPIDRIKIAQNFVKDLEAAPGNVAIVKATIGLCRELGIEVIAEGVETREQFELLKDWGCGEVQGFYFARPLAVEDVTPLLRSGGILDPLTVHRTGSTP